MTDFDPVFADLKTALSVWNGECSFTECELSNNFRPLSYKCR